MKSKQSDKRHPFIALMGGMGSGKTTALEVAQKHLGFHPIREVYRENNFLPLFYADMPRFALASQLFFLAQKANQLAHIQTLLSRKPIVLDVAADQDACYVEAQRWLGIMSDTDYRAYHNIRRRMLANVPTPDLLIYLKTPLRELKKRIAARGRSYENAISARYLSTLQRAQDEWAYKHATAPIVVIHTTRLDFANTTSGQVQFADIVSSELKRRGLI